MTTDELRQSVERLRALSPKLNEATDNASELIAAVETFLNDDCSIGLPASVVTNRTLDDEQMFTEFFTVSYERWGGKFRIVVELAHGCDPTGEMSIIVNKAWDQCPRDLKLKALQQLPELLNKVADEAEKVIGETSKTTEVISDMLAALRRDRSTQRLVDRITSESSD